MLRGALSVELPRRLTLRESRLLLMVIGVFFLASRLALLNFNDAEFTDGYQILQWSFHDPIRWHPLYPLVIKPFALFLDPIFAGRLVAALAGFLTLIPLSDLARVLYGKRTALLTCMLFAVSPLNFWLETRVLTESLFVLFCVSAVAQFLQAINGNTKPFLLFTLFSSLAFLTRPDGYLFLPVWLYGGWKLLQRKQWKTVLLSFSFLFPSMLYLWWMSASAPDAMYEHTFGTSLLQTSVADLVTRLAGYLEIFPYIVFYPIFVLAFLHFFSRRKEGRKNRGEIQRIWHGLLIYIVCVWFTALCFHYAWSTRFLVAPATLILVEAAAMLIDLARKWKSSSSFILASSLFAGSLVFAMAGIYGQKEVFNDIKEAAFTVEQFSGNSRIFTDEFTKTSFYTTRALLNYDRQIPLRTGDVVMLHSFYTDLESEKRMLESKHRLRMLHFSKSKVLPMLCGLPLRDAPLTNNIVASLERFHSQNFYSVVYQIQ